MRGADEKDFEYQIVPNSCVPDNPDESNRWFETADSTEQPDYMPLAWFDHCVERSQHFKADDWLRAYRMNSNRADRGLDTPTNPIPNIYGARSVVYPSNANPPGGFTEFIGHAAMAKGRFVLEKMKEFDWKGKRKEDFYTHFLQTVCLQIPS